MSPSLGQFTYDCGGLDGQDKRLRQMVVQVTTVGPWADLAFASKGVVSSPGFIVFSLGLRCRVALYMHILGNFGAVGAVRLN